MKAESSDIIIVGTGPAGLSAAMYARRQGLDCIVFGNTPGGILYMIESVNNYPGFTEGIPGMQLGAFMYSQAMAEGAEFTMSNVECIEQPRSMFRVIDTEGKRYEAPVAIVATGATLKPPAVENADLDGIHTCAMCDGPLYRGKDATLVILGGDDRGGQLSILLSKIAAKIVLVNDGPVLGMNRVAQTAMSKAGNIEVLLDTEVLGFTGQSKVEGVRICAVGASETVMPADAVFIASGWSPNTTMIHLDLKKTPQDYLITNAKLMTSCDGLYAAGDVRDGDVKQIVTACADGARAAVHAAGG